MKKIFEIIIKTFGKQFSGGSLGGNREQEMVTCWTDYKFLGKEYRIYFQQKQNLEMLKRKGKMSRTCPNPQI